MRTICIRFGWVNPGGTVRNVAYSFCRSAAGSCILMRLHSGRLSHLGRTKL